MAILYAVERWRPYLQQGEFIIKTDQRSLVHLEDQRLTTPWQQKAMLKLLGLQFKIVYKKGVENIVADALSRRPQSEAVEMLQVAAVSTVKPIWLEEVVRGYQNDEEAQQLITTLALGKPIANFTLKDGLLRYKNRVWLGHNTELQNKVLNALHSAAIGGHSGFPVTYRRVKQLLLGHL